MHNDLLEELKSLEEKDVIVSYSYELDYASTKKRRRVSYENNKINNSSRLRRSSSNNKKGSNLSSTEEENYPWKLKSNKSVMKVHERFDQWCFIKNISRNRNSKYFDYNYDELNYLHPIKVGGKCFQFRISHYRDISVINSKLCELACIIKHDDIFTLRTLLTNMEILQVAIGQLHELTFDAPDFLMTLNDQIPDETVPSYDASLALTTHIDTLIDRKHVSSNSPNRRDKINQIMQKLHCNFEELFEAMEADDAFLSLSLKKRGKEEVHRVKPMFMNASQLSCFQTLSDNDCVYTLESFTLKGNDYLATATNTIKLWDMSDNSFVTTLRGHDNCVTSLTAYEKDGCSYLASGEGYNITQNVGQIRIWDLEKATCVHILTPSSDFVPSLVSYTKKEIILDDPKNKANSLPYRQRHLPTLGTEHHQEPFSKHKQKVYLASGTDFGSIELWDLDTLNVIETLRGHESEVYALEVYYHDHHINHNTTTAKSTPHLISAGDHIKIWSLEDYSLLTTLRGHKDWVCSLAIFEDNNRNKILASGSHDKTIQLWKLSGASTVNANSCYVESDSDGANDDNITLSNAVIVQTGSSDDIDENIEPTSSLTSDNRVRSDNNNNNHDDNRVSTSQQGKEQQQQCVCHWIDELTYHIESVWVLKAIDCKYNGKCLVSGSHDTTVKIYSLDKREVIKTFTAHHARIYSLATVFESSKNYQPCLVSADQDGLIKLWTT